MSIFLGNPTYSPVSGYTELQGDMSEVNSTIWFSEGRILKGDDGYAFCLIADKISDLGKADQFKSGTPICWIAHTKQYTRWTKDNPKLPVEPTPLELLLIDWVENGGKEWLEKSFSGKLHLIGNERVVHSAKASKNIFMFIDEWVECEPNLIKDVTIKAGGNSGKKTSYSGQTEASKLDDRFIRILSLAESYGQGCTGYIQLAFGLAELKKTAPEAYEEFKWLVNSTLY